MALLALSLSLGCTTWSTVTSFGATREVGRRARGEPSFATSSSSSVAGGFVGAGTGGLVVAGFGAGTESVTRTRCVQDVDIAYEQSYEIHPTVIGRSKDRLAAIALMVGGVLMVAEGMAAADDPYADESPAAGYALGGGLIAGGVGLLVYSRVAPTGPAPQIARGANRWVATQTVETTGCLPPAAPGPTTSVIVNANTAAPSAETAERLRTLDKLRALGTINEAEYKRKRAEIVDGI